MRRDVCFRCLFFFLPPVCLLILPVCGDGITHKPVEACLMLLSHLAGEESWLTEVQILSCGEICANTIPPSHWHTRAHFHTHPRLAALSNLWNRRSDVGEIILKLRVLTQLSEVTSVPSISTTRGLYLSNAAPFFFPTTASCDTGEEETTGFLQ